MSSNLFAPRKQSLRFNDLSLSYICQLCINSSQVTKWLDICSLVASMHRLQGPLPDGDELFQWCRFYLHLLTWAGTQLHWLLCAMPFVGCHGGVGVVPSVRDFEALLRSHSAETWTGSCRACSQVKTPPPPPVAAHPIFHLCGFPLMLFSIPHTLQRQIPG